jgi:hypothetical protein
MTIRYFVETRKDESKPWTVALILESQAEAEDEAAWERARGKQARVWRAELITA